MSMPERPVLGVLCLFLIVAGCYRSEAPASAERRIEATSLLGQPLFAPELAGEFRAEQESLLLRAEADLRARPDDPDALIWVGRRQAYLGRYRAAIETYSEGLERHPDEARLFRHRGHRHITVRELDRAARDLGRAADLIAGQADQVEPD